MEKGQPNVYIRYSRVPVHPQGLQPWIVKSFVAGATEVFLAGCNPIVGGLNLRAACLRIGRGWGSVAGVTGCMASGRPWFPPNPPYVYGGAWNNLSFEFMLAWRSVGDVPRLGWYAGGFRCYRNGVRP